MDLPTILLALFGAASILSFLLAFRATAQDSQAFFLSLGTGFAVAAFLDVLIF